MGDCTYAGKQDGDLPSQLTSCRFESMRPGRHLYAAIGVTSHLPAVRRFHRSPVTVDLHYLGGEPDRAADVALQVAAVDSC